MELNNYINIYKMKITQIPSVELFKNNKMCYRCEFNLDEFQSKLRISSNENVFGKIGFEFVPYDPTIKSSKKILDTYLTNSDVNISVKQKGKLIVRFITTTFRIVKNMELIIDNKFKIKFSDKTHDLNHDNQENMCLYFATF